MFICVYMFINIYKQLRFINTWANVLHSVNKHKHIVYIHCLFTGVYKQSIVPVSTRKQT